MDSALAQQTLNAPSSAASSVPDAPHVAPLHADLDVSLVIPCLNELKTLGAVIEKGLAAMARLGLSGEVLVSDNGSTDGSIELAERLGARVVHAPARGYGNALRHGMRMARGRFLIMGDADDTYDFGAIDPFIEQWKQGATFVMGTRLPPGRIMPGANPALNRYVGTPVLTFILNRLFGTRIHDVNCGMRGLTRECFQQLDLRSEGMEFASEMLIKAALHQVKVAEVPITLYPDRRGRPPHLRRWRDGWRHLEFMLVHAPDQLLFWPGLMAMFVGLLIAVPLSFGPVTVGGRLLDFHTLLLGGSLTMVGLQGFLGALLIREIVGGVVFRPSRLAAGFAGAHTLLRGLLLAGALFALGFAIDATVLVQWARLGFSNLFEPSRGITGLLLMTTGAEIGIFSFLFAALKKHLSGTHTA